MNSQKLLSHMRKCIKNYDMIQAGDKIAIGLSGGKDSFTLLHGLKKLQSFYPEHYELVAIYVNLGITNDSEAIRHMENYCKQIDVSFYVVNTEIYSIVFEERNEKNPCSLCAKMRKGALNDMALSLGCNKIAYAHHKDDFIETSIMSLIYEGHYYCFPPVTYLEKTGLTVIRPLLYVDEKEIYGFSQKEQFPIMKNPCPADGNTKREEIKQFIKKSEKQFPDFRKNLNAALLDYFQKN